MPLCRRTRTDQGLLAIAGVEPAWPAASPAPPALSRIVVTAVGGARYDYDRVNDRFLVVESSATSADCQPGSRSASE